MTFFLYLAPIAIALVALWLTLILIRAGQRYEQVLQQLQADREAAIEGGDHPRAELIDFVLGLLEVKNKEVA